jgi:hypothetical protein
MDGESRRRMVAEGPRRPSRSFPATTSTRSGRGPAWFFVLPFVLAFAVVGGVGVYRCRSWPPSGCQRARAPWNSAATVTGATPRAVDSSRPPARRSPAGSLHPSRSPREGACRPRERISIHMVDPANRSVREQKEQLPVERRGRLHRRLRFPGSCRQHHSDEAPDRELRCGQSQAQRGCLATGRLFQRATASAG